MTLKEWRAMRISSGNPVNADLQMLIDPGMSPDGTSIAYSEVEELSVED